MTAVEIAAFAALVFGTSFIAGIFGMAGGMILMAGLLVFTPVGPAMMLHGAAQLASNGWRMALWRRRVSWRVVGRYLIGLVLATACFALVRFVPDRAFVLIVLGLSPFLALAAPARFAPRVDRRFGAEMAGAVGGALQLVSGVAGPLLDLFFVRTGMDRRDVVATKASCQTATHFAKLIYFGSLGGFTQIEAWWTLPIGVAAAVAGTSFGPWFLERMSEAQFRRWTRWIVCGVGAACLLQGLLLMMRA